MSMLQGFTQGINIRLIGSSNLGDTMSEAVSQMDRFKTSAKSLMKIGGWALGVGTALAGFAALTVKSTTDTTKALGEMASLGFIDLQSLEQAAGEFSSQFAGVTKPDFIAAAYDIKSGIASLSDVAVGQFTKIAALTAKATKASVAEMTSLFATGYGIYKDYYGNLSDFEFGELFSGGIAESVRAFKTTGPQMAAAISNLGASATSAKRPLEEQLAVLGMLQATMAGSEAGTHYRAFIKSAAEAGQQLGISFVDVRNDLLPVTEILQRIKGKYGETVDAVEKMELQKAFGRIEAMAAVDLLLPQIGALTSNIDMLGTAMQGGTASTFRMAESMNSDLGAAFGLLKQRVHNAFEVLGKAILPVVTPMVQAVSQAAVAFQQWGEAHPGLVKLGMGVALIGGAVLTVLGGLALTGGMLQLGMAGIIGLAASLGIGTAASLTFSTALGGLAGALWATLSPLLPIMAAAGLLYFAWKTNFLGLRDTTVAVWTVLRSLFGSLKTTITTVWNVISPIFGGWISVLSNWFTAWNDGLTGAKSPLLKFAGLIAYAVGFSIGILSRLFGWFRQHKALGAGLGIVFAGGALGVFKYVKATGGLVNAVSVLPYYLRVAGAELKYLTLRMAAYNPAALPGLIKSAFTAMATSVRSSVAAMITSLSRGTTSDWTFALSMTKATASWAVGFAKGIG
ncbi:MAG: phage tail tape measure protein, partial [Calditrichaeota bacterium]|nr:phage tail tape measure protein [Calditrichota bacterium]